MRENNELDEVAGAIERYINTFDRSRFEKLGERMATIHPTLQQNFMRVVLAFIKAEAKKCEHGYFDGRNEATAKLCAKLQEVIGEDAYLPFI